MLLTGASHLCAASPRCLLPLVVSTLSDASFLKDLIFIYELIYEASGQVRCPALPAGQLRAPVGQVSLIKFNILKYIYLSIKYFFKDLKLHFVLKNV
jgi:hypothetical protein